MESKQYLIPSSQNENKDLVKDINFTNNQSDELSNTADSLKKEEVVMPDECGDTLWDAVLKQERNDDNFFLGSNLNKQE